MSDTVIGDGQVSTGAVLNNGDNQQVVSSNHDTASGGKAILTTINAGGNQTLEYGTSDHVTINPGDYRINEFGGHQLVSFGGVSNNTILSGPDYPTDVQGFYNGRQDVGGGTAYNTVVDGGHQAVYESFATDANGLIIPGTGVEGVAVGSVLTNGGEQFISYGGVAKDTVIGNGGRQLLDGPNAMEQNDHLLPGGSITFVEVPFDASASMVSFDQASGMLTVTEGSASQSVQLAGNYTGQTFEAQTSSAYYGTEVRLLCFGRGTAIATMTGECLVEALKVGDQVITASGKARPIRWLGSSTTVVHQSDKPVIVRAGAFIDGSPTRDLQVTPGHSFLFGDVLVPIGVLVNGISIIADSNTRVLELYHVELDRHDVIFANGSLAESYRDDGNRIHFTSEVGERVPAQVTPSFAPIVKEGRIVEQLRQRLIERAQIQSYKLRGNEFVRSSIS